MSRLEPLCPVPPGLARRHPGQESHVIGAGFRTEGIRAVCDPWSYETEVALTARRDGGIAPLPDTEWTPGKRGLELLLCMAPVTMAPGLPVPLEPAAAR